MNTGEAEVKVRKPDRIVGIAKYAIYETSNEALNHPTYGLGETKLLELLNAQVKTNAMNVLRATATKGPTKSLLRAQALNDIVQEIATGNHKDCIGNESALMALVERRMSEIEARIKAEAGVVVDSEEDEEEVLQLA